MVADTQTVKLQAIKPKQSAEKCYNTVELRETTELGDYFVWVRDYKEHLSYYTYSYQSNPG